MTTRKAKRKVEKNKKAKAKKMTNFQMRKLPKKNKSKLQKVQFQLNLWISISENAS